jgi:thymidine kinase
MNKKIGTTKIITGPMFAGKTTALIREYNNINPFRKILVFKPQMDNRYSSSEIVSHNKKRIKAEIISHPSEIEDLLTPKINDIIIDELHFFPPDCYIYLEKLSKKGINITLAGLD